MDDAFGHWLAGFIDGEGCFTIQPHTGKSFAPRFQLGLRADDRPILELIRDTTGIGFVYVYTYPPGSRTARGNLRTSHATWHVKSRADIARLVELLDRFPLRAKKAADFAIFREAVGVWLARRGYDREAAKRLGELATALRIERAYRIPATTEIERQSPVIPPAVLRAG